jgi:phosphoketolase
MVALDSMFVATVLANSHLRPRVGNPDEMRSNRMERTLEALKFRVTDPEPGIPEDLCGAVITALNEEAVACAALANKGGINIIVTYEAFAPKMHGAIRQEITFAAQCNAAGRPQRWLSLPLVLTSHTWENAKNEYSHQDPAMAELMMAELRDISRVMFIPDANTAAAVMKQIFLTQGEIWTLVVPKASSIPDLFSAAEATALLERGAACLDWACYRPNEAQLILTAIGAYQPEQILTAAARLADRDVPHLVNYMIEPARFRRIPLHSSPISQRALSELYPPTAPARIFVSHTRPEPILGALSDLHTGPDLTGALGFLGRGGTLNTPGLMFVNGCSWGHILAEAARVLAIRRETLLSADEIAALDGGKSPDGILVPIA